MIFCSANECILSKPISSILLWSKVKGNYNEVKSCSGGGSKNPPKTEMCFYKISGYIRSNCKIMCGANEFIFRLHYFSHSVWFKVTENHDKIKSCRIIKNRPLFEEVIIDIFFVFRKYIAWIFLVQMIFFSWNLPCLLHYDPV